jgi:hypothetical protein
MRDRFHVYSVANNSQILARDLQASPDIASQTVPLTVFWDQPNASRPYASVLKDGSAEYSIFAHQDVYFPAGWFDHLSGELKKLDEHDPNWAVAGVFGADFAGDLWGHVWDSALGGMIGEPFARPIRVASLDEIVLIVKRGSPAGFDPNLPGFHLYGSDVVLTAAAGGGAAYLVHAPVIHNTKPIMRLGRDYVAAYQFMCRKWRAMLPYPTVIVELSRNKLPLLMQIAHVIYRSRFRRSTLSSPVADPQTPGAEITRKIFAAP